MKQEFSISSNPDLPKDRAKLSVRIGDRHAGFVITDSQTGELSVLAMVTGEDISSTTLDELLEGSASSGTYQQVTVCYDHPQSLLVPFSLYDEPSGRGMLEAGYGIMETDVVLSDRIPAWQVVNTYAVPAAIHQWVKQNFPAADEIHQYTVSVKNIAAIEDQGHLLVDFRSDQFTVLVIRKNDLMLAQTFPYTSPPDVIYYLLKCTSQFELPADNTKLVISGLVDQQSILCHDLQQYFLGIEFRSADWSDAEVQTYPSHFFTSLNDLARCES